MFNGFHIKFDKNTRNRVSVKAGQAHPAERGKIAEPTLNFCPDPGIITNYFFSLQDRVYVLLKFRKS
jgi:hypothetical protein